MLTMFMLTILHCADHVHADHLHAYHLHADVMTTFITMLTIFTRSDGGGRRSHEEEESSSSEEEEEVVSFSRKLYKSRRK